MFLYHGTNKEFDVFDLAKGVTREDSPIDGYLGIWTGVTTDVPARFGKVVLVVETVSSYAIEMPRAKLGYLTAKINLEDFDPKTAYRALAESCLHKGADLIAIREWDGRLGAVIVLKPSNAKIVSSLDSSDKAGLMAAEAHYSDLRTSSLNGLQFLIPERTRRFRKSAKRGTRLHPARIG